MKKILLVVLSLVLILHFTGCKKKSKKEDKSFSIVETTWISNQGDEFTFLENEIKLSRNEGTEFETYFLGEYKLYFGDEALKYLTNELKSYNVTEKDINDLIDNNNKYNKENFVVFDIRYSYGVDNGEKYDMGGTLIPWYGFLIDDDKAFDIINMNANSSLKLTKKD